MTHLNLKFAVVALVSAGMLVSCTSDPKPAPTAAAPRSQTSLTTQPGVAGGVFEDVIIAQAVVSAVDQASRKVTLTGSQGGSYTFTAGPEIKNLPQMSVGDKVTATFARRMVITVRAADAPASVTLASERATALPGSKPGLLVAEETELVGKVRSIDSVSRTAVLEFADGITKTVPIRRDIDLSRYQAGDNVIIRHTTALTVLVETP